MLVNGDLFLLQYLEERENYLRTKKELDILKEGKKHSLYAVTICYDIDHIVLLFC